MALTGACLTTLGSDNITGTTPHSVDAQAAQLRSSNAGFMLIKEAFVTYLLCGYLSELETKNLSSACFLIAVIKVMSKSNLRKKGILLFHFTAPRTHHWGKSAHKLRHGGMLLTGLLSLFSYPKTINSGVVLPTVGWTLLNQLRQCP